MMEIFLNDFGLSGLLFLKLAIIVGMLLYIVFAFIILKQVRLMSGTLEIGFERPMNLIAKIHLLTAVLILIFALFI